MVTRSKEFYKFCKRAGSWLLLLLLCFASPVYAQQQPEPRPDILDSLISIVIILFILSVIVEKITQLIRKYAPFIRPSSRLKRTAIGRMLSSIWRNINKRQTGVSPELDKKIEREVNSLSFVIALTIAILFRVDLFKMFKAADPRTVLFWSEQMTYTEYEKIAFVLSIALTAFFLTFGSKFFHDLIDTLLHVKNLKRKALDENTFRVETIEEFDAFIEKRFGDIIETAIEQNSALLNENELIGPPMHGKMRKDGKLVDCITIHVAGSSRGNIPSAVQAKLPSGQVVTVPVHVVFDVEVPTVHVDQGGAVSRADIPDFKGTICCRLKRPTIAVNELLTCSHVLTNGTADNMFGNLNRPVPARISNLPEGNFVWAVRNDTLDAALIQPASDTFTYKINPLKERALTPADMVQTPVQVVRQNGNVMNGSVVNYRSVRPIPIQYAGKQVSISNLIVLAQIIDLDNGVYNTLTVPGDSGACVYDGQGHPVGMILAGNSRFSYAIPMTDILSNLSATIIP